MASFSEVDKLVCVEIQNLLDIYLSGSMTPSNM